MSEIAPLLIVIQLEQYDYVGARPPSPRSCWSISFALLFAINLRAGLATPRLRMPNEAAAACHRARPRLAALAADRRWRWASSALILALPLVAVFAEGFRKGVDAYLGAIREPDALAALKLTLTVAAIAVPLNVVFGLAASLGHRQVRFPRQEPC